MKKLILLLVTILFDLLAFAQDYPDIYPEGDTLEVHNVLGGKAFNKYLAIPVTDTTDYTNPELREVGQFRFNPIANRPQYRDSIAWVNLKREQVYNLKYPNEFTFRPFNIYENGDVFFPDKSNWDVIKNKVSKMKPYYLDYVDGSNSNNGESPITAYKTLGYAITQGARLIYLEAGDIIQNDGWGSITHNLNEDVVVIAKGAKPAYVLNNLAGISYSVESGATYQATITAGTYPNIIDFNFVDAYGYPLSLLKKTSLAEVNANVNSYYITGTTLYIHLQDGRSPDSNVHVLKTTTDNYFASQNQMYFYAENIMFMGGGNAFALRAQNSTGAGGLIGMLNNCVFMNANTNGFAHTVNPGISWLEDCKAYRNGRDGFNYSQGNNYTTGRFIEVRSQGFANGIYTTDLTSAKNGSSAHNKITGIRISCKYWDNVGPNCADVNGAKSLNIGIECFSSLGFDDRAVDPSSQGINWADWGDFAAGTISTEAAAKMWLYGCTSVDNRTSFFTPEFLADNTTPDTSVLYVDKCSNKSTYSGSIEIDEFATGDAAMFSFPALSTYTAGSEIITQSIINGITYMAPSSDAVFDADALKANLSGGNTFSGTQTFSSAFAVSGGSTTNYIRGNGSHSNFGSDVRAVPLAGFSPITGTVISTDTVITAFKKLAGNQELKAPIANPIFTTNVTSPKFTLSALNTAPSSATDTGTTGEIRITSDYIYVCIATNTWVRAALSTW